MVSGIVQETQPLPLAFPESRSQRFGQSTDGTIHPFGRQIKLSYMDPLIRVLTSMIVKLRSSQRYIFVIFDVLKYFVVDLNGTEVTISSLVVQYLYYKSSKSQEV
jgi:hypothetical protein